MKYLFIFLLTIIFSANTLAELNPRDQKLAELIQSGNLAQLKNGAKRMIEAKASSPELLDMAAEVLLRMYADPYPSEVDTLSWLARAIGASENGRYHAVLTEVSQSAGHKKLQGHAKKALKALGEAEGTQYVAGMKKLPQDLYARESNEVRDKRILDLILKGDLVNLKTGAKEVINTRAQNVEINDVLAEILSRYHSSAYDGQIETFAWVAKALGQSTSGRYYDVLKDVASNGAHKKLRKHAAAALKKHGDAKGEQYSQGMLKTPIKSYEF